jgi:hypothetical protein
VADNTDANQAELLLKALCRERAELGDIASELIALLQAAGVQVPDASGSNDPSPD